MKNSRLLLMLLVLGVVGSFYYAWQSMPREEHAKGVRQDQVKKDAGAEVAASRFDFSGGKQLEFSRPKKDLFRQLFPPPAAKPAPPVIIAPPPAPTPEPAVVIPAPPPPPPPVPVVSAAMPNFTLLGFLEKKGELTAFIAFQGKIHLVKKGQKFADEFRVVGLDSRQITIGRIQGAGEVTLPLAQPKESGFSAGGTRARTKIRSGARFVHPVPIAPAPFVQPMPEVQPASPELETPPAADEPSVPVLEAPSPEAEPPSPGNDTN